MSEQAIRGALQTRLLTLGFTDDDETAFENAKFTPTLGKPYQELTTSFIEPWNNENNANYRAEGIFQVLLAYPLGEGVGAITARAELIRHTFKRGTTVEQGGVTTTISRTPWIGFGIPSGDRFWVPVRARFYAHIAG